jgi:type IV pilus assembly protein PilX
MNAPQLGPIALVRQRGAVLVVGLIFLAMLSLLGVAAYSVATQEERMSGNTRDRIRAFEAAEASLRDCEAVLAPLGGGLPAFNGTNGMYTAPAPDQPQQYEMSMADWKDAAKVRTIPTALPDVSLQPRCIVEQVIDIEVPPEVRVAGSLPTTMTVYRITALGFGANAGTSAMVQSMYVRP